MALGLTRRREAVSIALATALGVALAVALTMVWLNTSEGPKVLVTTSGCVPPCPQIRFSRDWLTGRSWETITIVDEQGAVVDSEEIETASASYSVPSVLVAPGAVGAVLGGTVGILAVRARRRRDAPRQSWSR